MGPKQLCKGVRKDGTPCRGVALPGSEGGLCFFHDPLVAEKRRLGRLKGGKTPRRQNLDIPPDPAERQECRALRQEVAVVLRRARTTR
jgi:hypothetical protein